MAAITARLPGYRQLHGQRTGARYRTSWPWRFVTHTTEVVPSSVAGAESMALRHPYPPHLWVWPEKNWKAQTVPLDLAAYALKRESGDPETNHARAIQVEIIALARTTPDKPLWWWEWLGEEVLLPVLEAGVPINLDRIAELTGSDGYGEGGKVRMSWEEWRTFDGVCAHSNVPGNAHWDIGDGNLHALVAAARRPTPTLSEEDDDMAHVELIRAAYHDARGTATNYYDAQVRDPRGWRSWMRELAKARTAQARDDVVAACEWLLAAEKAARS